jgi:hypothetical protein
LLKRLLHLNKLAEQLGLGGHYFSHVGGGGGCYGCLLPLAPKPLGVL